MARDVTICDRLEGIYELGYKAYRRLYRGTALYRSLDRREPLEFDGVVVRGWCEYTAFRLWQFLRDEAPYAEPSLSLDGLDSQVLVSVSDEEAVMLSNSLEAVVRDFLESGVSPDLVT